MNLNLKNQEFSKMLLVGDREYTQKIIDTIKLKFENLNQNFEEDGLLRIRNKYFESALLVREIDFDQCTIQEYNKSDCIIIALNEYNQQYLQNFAKIELSGDPEVKILIIDCLNPENPKFSIENFSETLKQYIEITTENFSLTEENILCLSDEENASGILRIIEAIENTIWKNIVYSKDEKKKEVIKNYHRKIQKN